MIKDLYIRYWRKYVSGNLQMDTYITSCQKKTANGASVAIGEPTLFKSIPLLRTQ